MAKHKFKIILPVVFLAILVAIFSNQHYRWFVINSISATSLSKQLLSQSVTPTPDWAIDLIIISNPTESIVTFSEHYSNFTYAYSPNSFPKLSGYNWSHLVGSWYVGKIEN